MTGKKKKSPVSLVPEGTTAPVVQAPVPLPVPAEPASPPEGYPHAAGDILDPILVLRLAHLQEKVHRLQAQQSGYQLLFATKQRELEESRHLTLTQNDRDLRAAGLEYHGVQEEIEKKHGIQLKNYTFDPDTGILNKIEEPKPMAPEEGQAKE